MTAADGVLLSVSGASKAWPGVKALDDVSFTLLPGEVHALVGENGAGKSTLSKIVSGLIRADSGSMMLGGEAYQPAGKHEAEARGVVMVMQELNLIPTLSVAENLFLNMMPRRLGFARFGEMRRRARGVLGAVGLEHIDPACPVERLGVGEQQLVEIAAALSRECRVLILDEPTASLTGRETALLFAQMARLKQQGVGMIYISHRMEEIRQVADRITVLRDGRWIATEAAASLSVPQIVQLMVGRDTSAEERTQMRPRGSVMLRVEELSCGGRVRGVSFEAYRGEILGFAGLMGSGRTETMRALYGADRPDSGRIMLRGSDTPARIRSPRDAVRQGIALLTEDRKSQGLLLPQPVRVNISLASLGRLSSGGWLHRTAERADSAKFASMLSVKCAGIEQPAGQLSGGNQQKILIARWLARDMDVLIFDEPTRGIDVGARQEIYALMDELASQGKTLLVVSSDMEELTGLCDRIAVMSLGRLARIFERGQWTPDAIMEAALSEHIGAGNGAGSKAA